MENTIGRAGATCASIVLQDHKRLPARFFAMISGALNGRLG